MKWYYFDTSIWIDIYAKRGYHREVAKELLAKIIVDDNGVVYSDITLAELKKLGFLAYDLNQMFSLAKLGYLKRIYPTREQAEEAKRLAKQRRVPFGDVFHAVLARDHDAQLVSRDWDFEKLKDIAKAKKTEDLL
ncbi:PIN domain-containing protein [Candidatus Woesearchaeota archaeon]|nr:PIN domain-containing protein [Candidatus Woesearchaeota archaeon]